MTEWEIKAAIEGCMSGNYSAWTIGVTDEPIQRKQERGNPTYWHYWDATTEEAAKRIESYFVEKGCKSTSGGEARGNYVYIF